jgi:hypothetical protein
MVDGAKPEAVSSASEMLEHLLTLHICRRQIAALPDDQIERLRELLKQAAAKNLGEQAVYNAVTRGFQNLDQQIWLSPPLAFKFQSSETRERPRAAAEGLGLSVLRSAQDTSS